jgi:hypothetical protein
MNEVNLIDDERTKCEIYQRVMGYHRPVAAWNIGKRQEFKDRVCFKEPSNDKLETMYRKVRAAREGTPLGAVGRSH